MAIQAASRYDYIYHNYFYLKKLVNENHNKIYLHIFCFGDYEIKKFKELKLNIKNFYQLEIYNFLVFRTYQKSKS